MLNDIYTQIVDFFRQLTIQNVSKWLGDFVANAGQPISILVSAGVLLFLAWRIGPGLFRLGVGSFQRATNWLSFVGKFFRYVFDVHDDLDDMPSRFDVGEAYRLEHDRDRFLHFLWHSVVYFPVIVVALVAKILGADFTDVLFFCMIAAATVSLEICIGIILSKADGISDLSRQTKRVLRHHRDDQERLHGWLTYLSLRHAGAREGIAKAALVTAVSLVFFGSIVGIEAIRLKAHSVAQKEDVIVHWLQGLEGYSTSSSATDEELAGELLESLKNGGHDENAFGLMALALGLSGALFILAATKLWIQTRTVLEEYDAMDRWENPEDAVNAYKKRPVHHLLSEEGWDNLPPAN